MSQDQFEKVGPWTKLSTELIYSNPWISVREDQVKTPHGTDGIYGTVHFKNRALGVVALTEDKQVILVGQHRYPSDEYSWEIPEGGGSMDEEPLYSIQRELMEETGYSAKEWIPLGAEIMLSNSVTDEKAWLWLARGLKPGKAQPEDTEELQVKKLPFEKVMREVINGEIKDSLSVIGILLAKNFLDQEGIKEQ